jgi:hypothetical protein
VLLPLRLLLFSSLRDGHASWALRLLRVLLLPVLLLRLLLFSSLQDDRASWALRLLRVLLLPVPVRHCL